jgi:aminoglycoside/choline kinase family phosphotransferase
LLEDLGDVTYWSALQEGDVDTYYTRALTALSDMQALSGAQTVLPVYDDKELQRELTICPDWFFARALSMDLGPSDEAVFERFSQCLLSVAAEQPSRFVHRDYHSRNLMVLDEGDIAIIDFQDAIVGPITYDAVSLLKDVYIVWPREQQMSWLAQYWRLLVSADYLPDDSWGAFVRWYDLMGLQRHVKILGVFSRLWLRDQKPAYMRDIPVVIDYIREACGLYSKDYSAIADFWKWFEDRVLPQVQQADWYATS